MFNLALMDRKGAIKRSTPTNESGMTTQTIVLVSIFVTVAIAAGVAVIALTRTSGEQAQQRIASEHISFQADCPIPASKSEGVVVSLDGFEDLAADEIVSSRLTLTSADTLGAYLTQGLVESDHGADLNFDNRLSDVPVSQILFTSKASEVYQLPGQTLTGNPKVIVPLENTPSPAQLKDILAKGAKLHINKTASRCWAVTRTPSGGQASPLPANQFRASELDDIMITYQRGCPRAASPSEEIALRLSAGGTLWNIGILSGYSLASGSYRSYTIDTSPLGFLGRLTETEHNVDLDFDGQTTSSAKRYVVVLDNSQQLYYYFRNGWINPGDLLPSAAHLVILPYHQTDVPALEFDTEYSRATLYINKGGPRCWSIATN